MRRATITDRMVSQPKLCGKYTWRRRWEVLLTQLRERLSSGREHRADGKCGHHDVNRRRMFENTDLEQEFRKGALQNSTKEQ